MTGSFKDISVTFFELISYVFPGFLLIFFLSILFNTGFSFLTINLIFVLFFSYILGGIIHEFSMSIFFPSVLLWNIYHKLKEKDKNGKGIQHPITLLGKIANTIKKLLEKNKNKNDLGSEKIIKKIFGLSNTDPINMHILKESILAENINLNNNYQYLHYQYIFNKSISLVLVLTAFVYTVFDYFYTLNIFFGKDYVLNIDGHGIKFALFFVFLSYFFSKRSRFFHLYRKMAMNAAVLLYGRKNKI